MDDFFKDFFEQNLGELIANVLIAGFIKGQREAFDNLSYFVPNEIWEPFKKTYEEAFDNHMKHFDKPEIILFKPVILQLIDQLASYMELSRITGMSSSDFKSE